MKETIILAPRLNGNELLRSLALRGVNCIGTRICSAAELARLSLMRSGISITEDFVSFREETAIVAEAVSGESYFGKPSFSDVVEIAGALRRMRYLVNADAEEPVIREKLRAGIFKEKNEALLHVYQKYMQILSDRKAVDSVSLIRRAANECRVLDADFQILEECPLNPLEEKLLEQVSGGKISEIKLQDLFVLKDCPLKIESIKNCYGASNEVETILADIYSQNRLDQCTVVVTDAKTYGQLFFDYALLYDIPITFGCGIPIMNSNPAKLLSFYYAWIGGGFYGADTIMTMLSSKAFNRAKLFELFPEQEEDYSWGVFYDLLGKLRFTDNLSINKKRVKNIKTALEEELRIASREDSKEYKKLQKKLACIPCLEIVGKELALPAEEFIAKYSYIRKGGASNAQSMLMMLDISASKAIYEELKVIRSAGISQNADEIIPNILGMIISIQNSEAGKLHVTGVDRAFGSLRENVYLAGMTASKFPGSPKENYLLLDADLKLFGTEAEVYTSDGRILRKREMLLALMRLASSMGSRIRISYPGLNVSDLKKENASSLIFELFREAHGKSATSKDLEEFETKVEYFEPAISDSRLVGKAYVEGYAVGTGGNEEEDDRYPVPWALDRAYSPTALENFFACPRSFMLQNILGIPKPEKYDPMEIISAKESGTLAHSLMEELGGSELTLEEFLDLSEEFFDRFMQEHPPLIAENISFAKSDFLEMMETAYYMEPHREIVLKEEDIECMHESGVRIHGFPDRVEKLEDGTYMVVDFKSGNSIRHVENDIATCLQVVIYAYLMEQKGFPVSECEYRYIRRGETVSCIYDDEKKRELSELLEKFKHYMEIGYFPLAETDDENNDPCHFCEYKTICGKMNEEGTVE